MSVRIHDDHSSLWISVDTSTLNEWYAEQDVCLLTSPAAIPFSKSSSTHSTSALRHNKSRVDLDWQKIGVVEHNLERNWSHRCDLVFERSEMMIDRKKFSIPQFCRISHCNLPLAARNFHRKILNSKLLRNFTRKSLVPHLYKMATAERALVFIGASITKQNVEALLCEVIQLDNSVEIIGNLSSLDHMKISWCNSTSQLMMTSCALNIHYIPFNGIRSSENLLVRNHSKHHGHHRTSLSDLKLQVDQFQMSNTGGMTLIVSVGSTYHSRMKFREDIGSILDWLNVLGEPDENEIANNRIFFRENSAQHWNSTSYGYQTPDSLLSTERNIAGHVDNTSCAPLQDTQNSLDWRNREVYTYARGKNLRNIYFIPFRDLTVPLFNMHAMPAESVGTTPVTDCTNFCFIPQLWQIVWYYLVSGVAM